MGCCAAKPSQKHHSDHASCPRGGARSTGATQLTPAVRASGDELNFDGMPSLKALERFVPPLRIGKVLKVYDGDTITVGAPLHLDGKRQFFKFSVRIRGIDCPEMRTRDSREKEVALDAKRFVEERVMNQVVHLSDVSTDKYGRALASVCWNNTDIGLLLLSARLAVPYDGGTKTRVEDWVKYRDQGNT